jgi:hypothetical protein
MNVADALGAHGPGWTIQHNGKIYRAQPITQKVKANFERWLSQRVLSEFLAAQEVVGGRYLDAVGVVADRIALGHYGFHGPVAMKAMQTPEGVFALSKIVFSCSEEEMIALFSEKGAEVKTIMKLVFAASFPKQPGPVESSGPSEGEQEGEDPNSPRPGG